MTHEVEGQADDTRRRAKRALWAFRLAFYPAVVAVGAILLIGRGDAATGSTALTGRTSQNASITFEVDGDGSPVALQTRLAASCPNGHRYWTPWRPSDGERVRFRRAGSRLWAMETVTIDYPDGDVGRGVYRLDAWVGDDRIEGVLEVVEHVDAADEAHYACSSESVGFTAQR